MKTREITYLSRYTAADPHREPNSTWEERADIAADLVEAGFARYADVDLDAHTVDELKEMLDARGIEYASKARKAELVALLEG